MQRRLPEIHTDHTGVFTYSFDPFCAENKVILRLEDDDIQLSSKDGAFAEFVVPSKVDGYDVKSVEGVVIPHCHTLRFEEGIQTINLEGIPKGQFLELILPKTLERICEGSFSNCAWLERAVIPSGVIGRRAFANCGNLRALELGNSVVEIGNEAFARCTALKKVCLPDNIRSLDSYIRCDRDGHALHDLGIFDGCTELESVYIGSKVECIAVNPFTNCPKLKVVEISPRNRWLEMRGSVLVDRGIKQIVSALPALLEEKYIVDPDMNGIAICAFLNCRDLREIEFPQYMSCIHNQAFEGCAGLQKVNTIAADEITKYAFAECDSLEDIEVHAHWLGECAFKNCKALRTAELYVFEMDPTAFSGCERLASLCNKGESQRGELPF